jgi:hypothetical protein
MVGVLAIALFLTGQATSVDAQAVPPTSSMDARMQQVLRVLKTTNCEAAGAAIQDGMEILYGGLRPLPSLDPATGKPSDDSLQAHRMMSNAEMTFAKALEAFAQRKACPALQGQAVDLKLFVEQMNEVAEAAGRATQACGEGATLAEEPCIGLQPLLDEDTGAEMVVGKRPAVVPPVIAPGYEVKLRSPHVPTWWGVTAPQEDVLLTQPIAKGECAVVFKETRGLMLRLRFDRIIIVTDPWVSTFGAPRGTRIPVWTLQWIPSEFVKEWNICNNGGHIEKTVTQRVVQDVPLTYFWRFYPIAPYSVK